jgi:hypothetical protein
LRSLPEITMPGSDDRGDESGAVQDAVHGRARDPQLMVVLEMPDDCVGSGIQTTRDELSANLEHGINR